MHCPFAERVSPVDEQLNKDMELLVKTDPYSRIQIHILELVSHFPLVNVKSRRSVQVHDEMMNQHPELPALLGKSHPVGVVLAAILFGTLRNGATRMQVDVKLSFFQRDRATATAIVEHTESALSQLKVVQNGSWLGLSARVPTAEVLRAHYSPPPSRPRTGPARNDWSRQEQWLNRP